MSYSSQVLDHYENPRNVGSLDKNSNDVGTGMVGAPACGDVMKLQILVSKEGVIEDAKFKTYGCTTSNTLVNLPTKAKKISQLKVGDEVLAWNGSVITNQRIKTILKRSVDVSDLLRISFKRKEGSKTKSFSLIVTKEHVFWKADNTPIEAQMLTVGDELYELTEHELRILTNIRHRNELKMKNSKRMFEFNRTFDHSTLPQNKPGYQRKDPETANMRTSIASRNNWANPAYRDAWATGMSKIDRTKPTSVELKFIDLFEKHNVAVKYSANKIWIYTNQGPASPDFIVPGKKKCIEVYTKRMPIHMQDRSDESDYVENRIKQFASAGYECLCLPIETINDALPIVQNFIHNGKEITEITPITHGNMLRGCERDGKMVVVYDLELEDGAHVFFTRGVGSHNCGSAISSSSLVTEWVKGKTIEQALSITNTDIAEELALPPVKIHCSILAEDAIKAAISDWKAKQEGK